MSGLTHAELDQINAANASGKPVVVFIHGLWLLSSSWDRWRTLFEESGFATIAPGWPDDPETVAAAKEAPDVFAHKMIGVVTDHYLQAIAALTTEPAIVGHSFGGLIAQKIAGEGVASSTVAIDAAPFRGVLPLPFSALKSSSAVLGNPANAGRAVALTFEQFTYGWANNLQPDEARDLYDTFHVAASGAPIFQAATANLNPWTEAKVDTRNPDRGPLLIIAGTKDNTVPLAITHAMFDVQKRNPGLTEIAEIPDRGHSLVIDHGWSDVAKGSLDFIRRTLPIN
ncbi:alpha/beta hydrolase [Herbiconiux sp. YIM B11900]|uniref:alpha/beta hydrolase n=1 Tax=Herbiconiux sp. YIM B11900 TaxID=3404131 RepID=UPI003F876432